MAGESTTRRACASRFVFHWLIALNRFTIDLRHSSPGFAPYDLRDRP